MIYSNKYSKDSDVVSSISKGFAYLDYMAYRQYATDLVYKTDRDKLWDETKLCQELPVKPTWFNIENVIDLDIYTFSIEDNPIVRIIGNRIIGLGYLDTDLICQDGVFSCLDNLDVYGLLLCSDGLFYCSNGYFTSTNPEYEVLGLFYCNGDKLECIDGDFICMDGVSFVCIDERRIQFVYNRLDIDNLFLDVKTASFLSLMKEDFQACYAFLRFSEMLLSMAMEADTVTELPQTKRLPEALQTIFKL